MTVESESRSQLNNRTWDETAVDWSFWGNYGEAHTCLFKYRCVLEYLLELWTVKMYWYLIWSLTEELVLACENSCQHRKVLKTFIWQEKKKSLTSLHEFMLSDQDNGKKKPTENNQSASIFQLVWFHLVTLVFASVTVLMTRNWWTTRSSEWMCLMSERQRWLLNYYEALQGMEWQHVAPCHLWPPRSVWDHCPR